MAGIAVRTLYNGNVYIDGTSYAGNADEIDLPEVKPKEIDHKPLSSMGAFDLVVGLDKMDMKIKWNNVNPDIVKKQADFYTARQLIVRSNMDIWVSGTKTKSVPVVATLTAKSRTIPGIGLKHQENADMPSEWNVTQYQLTVNGEILYDIDLMAQVYIVDGVDLLQDYRNNLGL